MPHINRIRVNNVKYNFGTQFYDDFLMRFSCKNTIYDLANGGGKSVLMLLLFQNLIPNCTLDDKQPIEKLFRTKDGSTTIHSMIEWRLSDVHIKDNFKYMLTGFCARRAREQGEDSSKAEGDGSGSSQSIEYFNYCIFYRNFNDNDIKNLPLSKNGERITYMGLKNYLKELEKKDLSLEVKIFDRKGDYQRFIAGYGLYESEWEIIRGINKTEGHVRTYFETNYKTTRKVVEDLLIEEIIEKSFRNNYLEENSQDKLAQTLLNIKDKLLELSKKKDQINHYDRQINIIDGFIERTNSIKQLYVGMEDTFLKLKKIYNTILENEQKFEGIGNELKESRGDLLLQKKGLSKRVETARVRLDRNELVRLERELSEKQEEYDRLTERFEALMDNLNLMEGGNHYLEYIETKAEYDKLTIVIDNLLKDNNELLTRLKQAVAVKKLADDDRRNLLKREIIGEKDKAESEKKHIAELEEKLRQADNEIAVVNHELHGLEEKLSDLNSHITKLKNNTSLLLPSDAQVEYSRKEIERVRLEEQTAVLSEQLKIKDDAVIQLRLAYEKCNTELSMLETTRESLRLKSEKIFSSSDKLEKLKEVYQENHLDKLEVKIEKAYKNTIIRLYKEKAQSETMKNSLEALRNHKLVPESEDVNKLVDYISRYHTKRVISGARYVAELEENARLDVIRENPMLLFSVIVYENMGQIMSDWEMPDRLELNHFVPIINAADVVKAATTGITDIMEHADTTDIDEVFKKIVRNESLVENKIVMCNIGDPERFKVSNMQKAYEELKAKISSWEQTYERKDEYESVIREDYLFVRMINSGLIDEAELHSEKSVKEIEDNISCLNQKLESLQAELEKSDAEKAQAQEELVRNKKQMNALTEETDILRQITEYLEQYKVCEKRIKDNNNILTAMKHEYSDNTKRLDALKNRYDHRLDRINLANAELDSIDKVWNERFASYYDERLYLTIANENKGRTLSDITRKIIGHEELDTEIEALLEGLLSDHSSVNDKEKLLNHYQISMSRSLNRLDYLGLNREMFDAMYAGRKLKPAKNEALLQVKKEADEIKNRQKQSKKLTDECRTARDTLQGRIHHSISLIEKNYGSYDESIVKSEEIDTFINENDKILETLNGRLSEVDDKIKNLEETKIMISVLRKNCERIMGKSGLKREQAVGKIDLYELKGRVSENGSNKIFDTATAGELEKVFNDTAGRLDQFINDRYKRGQEFERELVMLADTLKKLGADALAAELAMNIRMPASVNEVEELINALRETNSLIELEKQRVEKGLSDIQIIKDNFENQCIQSCMNIKAELERLSRLSRITIDHETISMIKLKIPYINEELFKDRMSEYIDRLAQNADTFETPDDRLKYIRNNLCWKKMFSVIVTDMNAIKLNLYKRERIAEQSRYLPYEEAVGSTGQSQGIYIQFLISIINYISSINSKNADATGLRKVIFIDNPFGAAKDVYIWEPIFKLLKTNNVQLIVPARGATPAITGRFDVNYVLGQKMCDGRQQTVVVDYFSDVVSDELEYTTLSYEQTALF